MPFGNIGDPLKKIGIIRYLEWPCAVTIVKVVRRDLHRRQALRVNFDTSSLLMMQFQGGLALSIFVRPRMSALMKLSARSNLNEYAVSFPNAPRPCGNSLAVYFCAIYASTCVARQATLEQ